MPRTDLIAPAAQAKGHVSKDVERLVGRIYDPAGDPEGLESVKRLRKIVVATRALQARRDARYVQRKAAGGAIRTRRVKP